MYKEPIQEIEMQWNPKTRQFSNITKGDLESFTVEKCDYTNKIFISNYRRGMDMHFLAYLWNDGTVYDTCGDWPKWNKSSFWPTKESAQNFLDGLLQKNTV